MKWTGLLVSGVLCLGLVSCTPPEASVYGMPITQYQNLSSQQQAVVRARYQEHQHAQHMLMDVLGDVATAVGPQSATVASSHHQSCSAMGCSESGSSASVGFG